MSFWRDVFLYVVGSIVAAVLIVLAVVGTLFLADRTPTEGPIKPNLRIVK